MADHDYKKMLDSFRTIDLQTLLGFFGRSRKKPLEAERKSELKDQALELLRTRSSGFNHASYVSKIHEIYHSIPIVIMEDNLLQAKTRQLMEQMQVIPRQRMSQPDPQYLQQPKHMTLGGLPQDMPQIQRPIYSNIFGAKIRAQMNVVSLVENNPYTPSPETVAQIKFKKLPFYEVIDEILKPTFLAGTDECTLQNFPEGMKESRFKLYVPLEAINIVAMNRDVSSVKHKYPYQFQIRISQLVKPMSNEVTDFMPLGLHIRLGGKTCPLPPHTRPGAESRRSPRPINCTELVKLSPITPNVLHINWTPDGEDYIMSMYLVQSLTIKTLIQRLQDKRGTSSEEIKNNIIKKLADVNPDLTTTSYRFSLVCPLGKIRMKIPAKSIHCEHHFKCFDAKTFILMNQNKPTWVCPICNKPCLYDDLQIDNYFLEVVSSPIIKDCKDCKEIEFLADGTWVVYEENKKTTTTNSTIETKLKPIDFVNLDSDEEKSVGINLELNPGTVKCKENENLKFVDLTLSDSEEEP